MSSPAAVNKMSVYKIGDRDDRPWGHYVVTGAGVDARGEEYCEKSIVVRPGQILSLQSHELRRETWTVKRGLLTALRDGERIEVLSGETIHIPTGSIHCMANLGEEDCIVEERQEGICREEDIRRYMDIYRRGTEALSPVPAESFTAYRAILADIKKIRVNRTKGAPY